MYLKMVDIMAKNVRGVPYLRFDGGCYFDLGIMATQEFELEIVFRPLATGDSFCTVGSQVEWSTITNRFQIGGAANGNIWFANPDRYRNNTPSQASMLNDKHTFYLSKSKYAIDGTEYSLGGGAGGTFNKTLVLGASYESSLSIFSIMDFFKVRCWRSGMLVADFIPASNDTIIDTVSKTTISKIGNGHALIHYE